MKYAQLRQRAFDAEHKAIEEARRRVKAVSALHELERLTCGPLREQFDPRNAKAIQYSIDVSMQELQLDTAGIRDYLCRTAARVIAELLMREGYINKILEEPCDFGMKKSFTYELKVLPP